MQARRLVHCASLRCRGTRLSPSLMSLTSRRQPRRQQAAAEYVSGIIFCDGWLRYTRLGWVWCLTVLASLFPADERWNARGRKCNPKN